MYIFALNFYIASVTINLSFVVFQYSPWLAKCFSFKNNLVGQKITSHVMTSSDLLPPPPLIFAGATMGTAGNQEKCGW